MVHIHPRYEWLYLYGLVRPQTGKTIWYLLPALNAQAFEVVLNDFAATVAASEHKRVLIVMDRAPWHNCNTTPAGIEIIYQPPYSPELQPAEHLWGLSDAPIKNRTFNSLDALEQTLDAQCVTLMADPECVKAHTLFHWWPTTT